ncbi:MAG: class I SAM-dependent methyltransferase [Pseudomonadota bacterium]
MMWRCPLCLDSRSELYHRDQHREYHQCATCTLIFVPKPWHLSAAEEKAEYDRHQNSPFDAGYRRFLSRLFTPLSEKLAPGAEGLDFGSGPGPTLSVMFEEAGHPMAIYDPFYAPEASVLESRYDFITATEVVEHLSAPGEVMARLAFCLRAGGYLGLMTKRVKDRAAFARWHYSQDPTHVAFFSESTFHWWARASGFSVEFPGTDAVIMQKH